MIALLAAFAGSALWSSDQGSAAAAGLSIRGLGGVTGYTGLAVNGPPGDVVQLSEAVAGRPVPIATVTLSSTGTAELPRALVWLCARRVRQIQAATGPPAAMASAIVTLNTPSCADRITARFNRRVRVGRSIPVTVHDRWRLGGLALEVCLTAPGGSMRCRRSGLRPGRRSIVLRLRISRLGGWRVVARTPFGHTRPDYTWAYRPGAPLRLLAAGDSEMQILDTMLGQELARHDVRVTSDARISTGLTNSLFFNWPAHARVQAPTLRPDVTIFFMGANDGFPVSGAHGGQIGCCSAGWSAGYANLVAGMMRTYLLRNAGRVYWFLLPAPRPPGFHRVFDAVNAGIRAAAARFPGRVGLIDANRFFTPGDRYRDFMSYHGHGFVIHEADGIHLSTASDAIDAGIVRARLRADHVIR